MTPSLLAARYVVAAAILAAPVAHAALAHGQGHPSWPTAVMLAIGLALRAVAGASAVATVALAVAPLWQVLMRPLDPGGAVEFVMPWLALLGAGLAQPVPGGWRSPAPWLPFVAGWGLVLALTGPVVVARELDFPRVTFDMFARDVVMAGAPPQGALFALLVLQAQLAALLVFDWYAGASETTRRRAWQALTPGAAVAVAVAVWQQGADPALLSREPWIRLHRAAGTFFDANAMAALAALAAPVLASRFVRPGLAPAWIWSPLVWAAATAAVVATGSRTSLAALAVVAAIGLAAGGTTRRWWALGGVATAGVATFAYLASHPWPELATGNAIERLAGSLSAFASTGPDSLSRLLWTRDGYGPTAMALIAEHPWVGGGVGTFVTLVGDYARVTVGVPLPADNAQNWWRHQVAELGLVGALPALACSALAAVVLARGVRRREQAGAVAPLAGLGLMSLVSPPTQHPIIQVVTALVVAHAACAVAAGQARLPRRGRGGLIIWPLALACAAGIAVEGWRTFRPSYRAVRFHTFYSYGVTDTVVTPFGEGRWAAPRSLAVLGPGGTTLVTRVVAPHDDVAARPVRITVSDRQGVVCAVDARDHSPFECRLPVARDGWTLVRVDVDRLWQWDAGVPKAALVSARFEP